MCEAKLKKKVILREGAKAANIELTCYWYKSGRKIPFFNKEYTVSVFFLAKHASKIYFSVTPNIENIQVWGETFRIQTSQQENTSPLVRVYPSTCLRGVKKNNLSHVFVNNLGFLWEEFYTLYSYSALYSVWLPAAVLKVEALISPNCIKIILIIRLWTCI